MYFFSLNGQVYILITELPIPTVTERALATLSGPTVLTAKALVMCEQNSTLMPTAMTRLTRETAFSWMLHQYIRPNMSVRIITMTSRITREDPRSIPGDDRVEN